MKPIYLSRVGITNFRTYGEDFSIDLPEEPGLTVLCGMNGLGKTAFFDAIEWALLGNVRRLSAERLRKLEGNPLTREGATPGSHRVELSWGNNLKVIRSGALAPTSAQLVEILKDPDWGPQIHDLEVYLRLTHFLPQATRERFMERDGKTQWSLLQGPAGVERLERLRKMLDDGKARNAFERRIVGLERVLAEVQQQIDNWQKLQADREQWANMATAAAAISPEELEPVLRELESSLPDKMTKKADAQPLQRLAELRTRFENLVTSSRDRCRDLSRIESSIRRYGELTQRIRALQETHSNIQKELGETQKLQEDAKGKVTSVSAAIANLGAKKMAADQNAATALVVLETEQRRVAAAKLRAGLEDKITALGKQLSELEQRRAAYRIQSDGYNAAVKGIELARRNIHALAEFEHEFAAFKLLAQEFDSRATEESVLSDRKMVLLNQRSSLEQVAAGLNEKIKGLIDRLAIEQRSVDDAARALGVVVQHLRPEDTVCPVCAQLHPPGDLLRKAQHSIARHNSRTGLVIDELRKLQREAEEADRGRAQCNSEVAELEAALTARTKLRADIEKRRSVLLQKPELANATIETLPSWLKERGETLHRQQNDFSDKASMFRVSDELTLAAQRFEAMEKSLEGELDKAKAEQAITDGVLQECQAKIETAVEIIKSSGSLDLLPEYRITCLGTSAKLEAEIQVFQGQLKDYEKNLQAIIAASADRVAKREADDKLMTELKSETDRLLAGWRDFSLQGEPSESAIQEARLGIEKRLNEFEKVLERIASTVVGVEGWARRTQLASIDQSIAESIKNTGANTSVDCSEILQRRFNEQLVALERARGAQKRAEDVARKLMELSEKFSASALEPLSVRISAFNRLISPFPYEFKLNPHVTSTRTRTQPRITIPSVRSNQTLERDPECWLSEGQMSAMGLSVLLGASTVYHWSRWRALLLDDPLQHTDLIHAAAFGDVIRGLMCDEGFQVIVSTHSYDEADFLMRKCRRANLPVRKLELLGFGPSGLRFNIRDL